MPCNEVEDRDFSNVNFPGDLPQPLPKWEVGLKIGACILVELVSIFGNVLLIAIVARTPRMRSTTNCYIANMAVADLLIALVPMWIHVSTDVMDQDGWPLGEFLCKFNSFVQMTAMVASVMTLMVIAGDRFFAIIFPLKARITERRVKVVVSIVWLIALGIGLPPLFFYTYTERQWKDYLETFCTDVWPVTTTASGECDEGLTSKRAYWTLVTVVLNWLPMAVMTIVYAIIIHRLRFSRVQPGSGRLSAIQQRSKRKVVKMLLIVLVTFMACTIPFQVTSLYPLYSHDTYDKLPEWHRPVYFAAVFLMYTNSAINPILYGGLNEKFRQGARDLFNCLLCRKGARSNLTMSTHFSLSRPRVSIVEDEIRKVKVKDRETKPSLRQLVVSAAYINTTLTAAKGNTEPKNSVVNFDHNALVIPEDGGILGSQNGKLRTHAEQSGTVNKAIRAAADTVVTFDHNHVVADDKDSAHHSLSKLNQHAVEKTREMTPDQAVESSLNSEQA